MKAEDGRDWKSKRSSRWECKWLSRQWFTTGRRIATILAVLVLEFQYYWLWGCVLLVHECLSAANNFVHFALILSSTGSYISFTTQEMTQDFCFESFWRVSIILCGKVLFSIGIGRDSGRWNFWRFSIFLLQNSCWDLVCIVLFAASSSSTALSHWQYVRKNYCSNLACLI